MVVRMRKWLPWPLFTSKKFQVYITVQTLEGVFSPPPSTENQTMGLMVDVKWNGPKGTFFRTRSLKRVRTSEKQLTRDGIISWYEKSDCECDFTQGKSNSKFQPWDVHFVVLKATHHQGGKTKKLSVMGTAVMDIANVIYGCEGMEKTTRINVLGSSGADSDAALLVNVSFMELWSTIQDGGDMACSRPSLPCISGPFIDDQESVMAGGGSDKSSKNAKRPAEGKVSQELYVLDSSKLSSQSETSSYDTGTFFDSDSLDDYDDGGLDDGEDSSFRKSFSYGSLAGANRVHEGALSSFKEGESFLETRVVADMRTNINEDILSSSDPGQAIIQQNIFSRLPWKKRKLFGGSPRERGEPLLNKSYGDDGGDDIDHDRRQSCSSPVEQLAILGFKYGSGLERKVSGCVDFGKEMFSVGRWEVKEFLSRDGHMKLAANVFFASIDQRNEKAAGESACTVLVAVIADWLHRNPNQIPNKAEFDSLIREGSAEWRGLCENEAYRNRFHDGHFDLDTVLEAKVRPLRVAPERSFVGFFQPEGMADNMCDFLEGAMLFDNIWDAIVKETASIIQTKGGGHEPTIFIVSWNDHFFILKVDANAFYIVDTLGERLYEGCDRAYIIRFDKDARLCHVVPKEENEDGGESRKGHGGSLISPCASSADMIVSSPKEGHVVGKELCGDEWGEEDDSIKDLGVQREELPGLEGKEACKCFLKEFFAGIPLRELQVDIKKGLLGKVPLHQRLQIEFHYMSLDV